MDNTNFIQLTEYYTGDPIIINVNHIVDIEKRRDEHNKKIDGSVVKLINNKYGITVKEEMGIIVDLLFLKMDYIKSKYDLDKKIYYNEDSIRSKHEIEESFARK